ncbi:hypothetical protein BRLA_c024970 [Brevibacillus laterosporus LMG 15441]|uniref:Uncharacterized protein n=1 Tax=Brevibacillus laterosporus LMG 15441 TaxID=1042163 RepID=A0A075R2Q6_BRELA|nr:hypothetical protein BRLA_c024970 [Brevibacillus laterosporus LMG 15441]
MLLPSDINGGSASMNVSVFIVTAMFQKVHYPQMVL